jgi:hypothetical protein
MIASPAMMGNIRDGTPGSDLRASRFAPEQATTFYRLEHLTTPGTITHRNTVPIDFLDGRRTILCQ